MAIGFGQFFEDSPWGSAFLLARRSGAPLLVCAWSPLLMVGFTLDYPWRGVHVGEARLPSNAPPDVIVCVDSFMLVPEATLVHRSSAATPRANDDVFIGGRVVGLFGRDAVATSRDPSRRAR